MNEEITPPQKEASACQEVLENENYDEKVSRITRVLKEAKDRLQEKLKKQDQEFQRLIEGRETKADNWIWERAQNPAMGENQERVKDTLPEGEYRCL